VEHGARHSNLLGSGPVRTARVLRQANPLEGALERVDVHFEFCTKLGITHYCFHGRDVSPECATIAETDAMFDTVVEKLAKKQAETGVQLLWGTCNLFSHPRYMNGAATNPDPAVVCMAAAQACRPNPSPARPLGCSRACALGR